MKRLTILLAVLFLCANQNTDYASTEKTISLINAFIQKTSTIKTCSFKLGYFERMDGKLKETIVNTKYNVSPFKMYALQEKPTKGLELLYVTGKNNNKVLVNPASFPWVNLSLSPYSSTIRAEGHYTVFETGFKYFADLAKHLIGPKKNDLTFNYVGTEVLNGKTYTKINITANNYRPLLYTVKEKETLRSISKKFKIAEYSMIELNNDISGFNEKLEAGDKIKVPNVYAKKVDILIDPGTNLPYKIYVYDDKGLFQNYTFSNVKLNPVFTEIDFSSENPAYSF